MIPRFLNSFRKYDVFAVSIVLLVIYFLFTLSSDYLQHVRDTIFWSPDSNQYRAVGDWIFGLKNTNVTEVRPFFYPLMLNLSRSFAGIYGIWCYQLMLWVLTGALLYKYIDKLTNNIALSIGGVFIYASNVTLLLLTLHALTEVTVVFMLTILIGLIVNKPEFEDSPFWLLVIFIVSLLAVTKPLYAALLFAVLVYRIPVVILNIGKWKHNIKLLLFIILSLSPVLIQLSIMKVKHDEYAISKIDAVSIKDYYFAMVFGETNHIPVIQAREQTRSFDQKDVLEYLLINYQVSLRAYFNILKGNFLSGSNFVNYPDTHTNLSTYTKMINIIYSIFHVLMLPASIFVSIELFKKKQWGDLEMILSLMLPMYLIMLTSGITFWQGDRIILPSLPLWLVLYSLIISKCWWLIKRKLV